MPIEKAATRTNAAWGKMGSLGESAARRSNDRCLDVIVFAPKWRLTHNEYSRDMSNTRAKFDGNMLLNCLPQVSFRPEVDFAACSSGQIRNLGSNAGSGDLAQPSAVVCPEPAFYRPCGALVAFLRDRSLGTSCGSLASPAVRPLHAASDSRTCDVPWRPPSSHRAGPCHPLGAIDTAPSNDPHPEQSTPDADSPDEPPQDGPPPSAWRRTLPVF